MARYCTAASEVLFASSFRHRLRAWPVGYTAVEGGRAAAAALFNGFSSPWMEEQLLPILHEYGPGAIAKPFFPQQGPEIYHPGDEGAQGGSCPGLTNKYAGHRLQSKLDFWLGRCVP